MSPREPMDDSGPNFETVVMCLQLSSDIVIYHKMIFLEMNCELGDFYILYDSDMKHTWTSK